MRPSVDVAVAIATLDRPDYLAACLDALLAGDALPGEIVVVDQSRGDQTQVLVAERCQSPVPIVYVRQARRGLSASRNAGLAEATRPVVAFTDDDCVPDRGWIAAVQRAFEAESRPDVVTGPVLPFGPAEPGTYAVSQRGRTVRADFRGRQIPWPIGTGGNSAMRREWVGRIGLYDERLGAGSPGKAAEDTDMLYRLLVGGAVCRYEPTAIVYHRRQSRAQRLASRWGYGHGIGAFCSLRLREGDRYASWILLYWLFSLCRELGGRTVRGDWLGAYQRMLGLTGTASGLLYGVAAGRRSG